MDPITTAIVAAVTAGVTEVGTKAISDAYQGLKDLIESKLGQDSKVPEAIDGLEGTPESTGRQMVLAENMALEKADWDPELVRLAEKLVQALIETKAGAKAVGKYQIDAKGAQIGVVGDNAKVEGGIHFGDSQK